MIEGDYMKKLFTLTFGTFLMLCFAGTASALLFSDTQHQNVWFSSSNTTKTWTFDLDNDALDWGDINSEDSINWAFLSFGTFDDHDSQLEYANINLDGTLNFNWEVDPGWWSANVSSLVVDDHFLAVTFNLLRGDFGVSWVNLFGDYTDNRENTSAAPVPEPATMLLLGCGLIGLAGSSRKKWLKR
jgi:hypothetical protein